MVAGSDTLIRCGFHVTISLHWSVLGLSVAMSTGNGPIPGPYVEVSMCVCLYVRTYLNVCYHSYTDIIYVRIIINW